jgi:hypothetical protein
MNYQLLLNCNKVHRTLSVDSTFIMPLKKIATEQTNATAKTHAATDQLLDYITMHHATAIRYHKSDMILYIHSDESYLSVSNSQSRFGGLFFCRNTPPHEDVINNVVASTKESELRVFLPNAQSGASVRLAFIVKLPQPQLRTYTQTGQSALRATQVRAALSHAYAVTYQNRITDKP